MPLTIAHVLSSFQVGGQERVALDLAAGQRAAGHRVLVISLSAGPDGPLAAEFQNRGVEVRTLPKGRGLAPTLVARLLLLLWRERVAIVHTHNPQPLVFGGAAARLYGAALVHTKHGSNRARPLFLRRVTGRLPRAFVAVSEATARVAREDGEAPPGRILVIPNGIDLSRFHPDPRARAEVRAALGLPPGGFVIGTVGRLSPEKDQALLLEAAAPLLGVDVRLLVVGTGSERMALEARVATLPGGRFVQLLGERNDVPRLLAALDCFALSSRTEGLPLVVAEAMATGLPVVATAVGGIPDVVRDGETGLLVPAGDREALALALARLARDRRLAEDCGTRGRKVALAELGADRMVRDYMAVYDRVRS